MTQRMQAIEAAKLFLTRKSAFLQQKARYIMKATEKKAIAATVKAIDTAHKAAHEHFNMLCDAQHDNMIFNCHTEAESINSLAKLSMYDFEPETELTNKEKNAMKRRDNEVATVFSASTNVNAQCYRIEIALNQFHTFQELLQLDTLKDVSKYRLRSHINFLDSQFKHTCRKEVNGAAFRYVLL